MERIKATEPDAVARVSSGALEERAQAGRAALGARASLLLYWNFSQAAHHGTAFLRRHGQKARCWPRQDSTSALKDRLEETVRGARTDADAISLRSQGTRAERTEQEPRDAEEDLAKQELQRWDEVFKSKDKQPKDGS